MVPIPTQIGPYRVLGLLGAGAMGSVFKAESAQGQVVALKMIGRPSDTRTRFRPRSPLPAFNRLRRLALVREARLAMELSHPNIVRVLDYGQHRGLLYLVMEFLEGQTLLSALRHQTTTLGQRLTWVAQVCDALAFAHRRGVLHRDLHANNVFVLRDGTVKVLDFGLARRMEDTVPRTQVARVMPFLAPEVLSGRRQLTAAADLSSVGTLLYFVCKGNLPFGNKRPGPDAIDLFNVPSFSLDPAHPCVAALQDLLRRALQSDPERKIGSASEFAAALRGIAAHADHGNEAIPLYGPPRVSSIQTSSPLCAPSTLVSIRRRTNRPRVLQHRLARFDMAHYLKRAGMTVTLGVSLVGYLEPETQLPLHVFMTAAAVALLPVLLLFPANLLLTFAAALAEVPRCRTCRSSMRRRRQVTQYAVDDTAVSLGIADSLASLEAGLWDDAGRLLSLHGQALEPLTLRRIAEAPLRLQLGLFGCACCPDESATFTVQEHREDAWVARAGYVEAYRRPHGTDAQPLASRLRPWRALPPLQEAARASLASIHISVVQWVCAAGLLFILWFTWADLHGRS